MSLGILLIPYVVLLGVWLIFTILIIGHLLRYSGAKIETLFPIAIYLTFSLIIAAISFTLIAGIDWQAPLSFLSTY